MIRLKKLLTEDSQLYKIIDARDLGPASTVAIKYAMARGDTYKGRNNPSDYPIQATNENTYVVEFPEANVVIGEHIRIYISLPPDWSMPDDLEPYEMSGGAANHILSHMQMLNGELNFVLKFRIPKKRVRTTKPTYKFKCGNAKNGELIFTCDLSKFRYIEDPEK